MSATLNGRQVGFLREFRRSSRPLARLMRDLWITEKLLARWRSDPDFERAYQRARAAVVREGVGELRMTFARSARLVAREVERVEWGGVKEEVEVKEVPAGKKARKQRDPVAVAQEMKTPDWKKCMEVLKSGMGTFVAKPAKREKRKEFPGLDPAAFEEFVRASMKAMKG